MSRAENSLDGKLKIAFFQPQRRDGSAVKNFLAFPLRNSAHAGALLISHNSFAVFLAERIFGRAFVKNTNSQKQLVAVREVFERLIFLRMKAAYSAAEIIARTASQEWMRGADASNAQAEKKRLALFWT